MNLGRYQLGTSVPVPLLCVDGSNTPVVPDAAPYARIMHGATVVANVQMPILDSLAQTGLFHYPLYLDSSYAVGSYQAILSWVTGSFHGLDAHDFEIIPAGHVDGAVTSMYFYRRPHADFVVQGLQSGKIIPGRNPRV